MQVSFQNNFYRKNTLNFGEGKAHWYSDFDKTYLPCSHGDFKVSDAQNQGEGGLVKHFGDIKKFLDNTVNSLKFTISSGRPLAEFETIGEMARDRKIHIPLPDTFIGKNGSDEYIRGKNYKRTKNADNDFYGGGHFPFKLENTNKEKEARIKELTGWDGKKIKEAMKRVLEKHDIKVREAGTAWGTGDYGWRSAFHNFSDNFDAEKNPNTRSPWTVTFRQDGDLKIHMLWPKDMGHVEERMQVFDIFEEELSEELKKDNIDWNNVKKATIITEDYKNKESGMHPTTTYMPNLNPGYRYEEPLGKSFPLTKFYDTEQAVKKAIKDNDLVVAAGDGSNDYKMLNPAAYIYRDLEERIGENKFWAIKQHNRTLLNEIKENHPDLNQKLKDMPFIGVVVKRKDKRVGVLEELVRDFGPDSEYKKIIVVEQDGVLGGVKQAIKQYADHNPKYKDKLHDELLSEVYGVVKEAGKKSKDSANKSSKSGKAGWIVAGVTAVVGGVGALFYKKNKDKKTNNKQMNPINYSQNYTLQGKVK